jgi:uncharacterized OsmC-like protein
VDHLICKGRESAESVRTYKVTVTRQDDAHAVATTRGHTLPLNIRKGDGSAGFNAAETLLAALGACMLTNLNSLAPKLRLHVDGARIEINAQRCDNPPALTEIEYKLVLDSPDRAGRLQDLHDLSSIWGTVSNTLRDGVALRGTLSIEVAGDEANANVNANASAAVAEEVLP